jgi:hypothetical protein
MALGHALGDRVGLDTHTSLCPIVLTGDVQQALLVLREGLLKGGRQRGRTSHQALDQRRDSLLKIVDRHRKLAVVRRAG